MITEASVRPDIAQLKQLWKEAFGDPDCFIDIFFETAYSPERCHFLMKEGQLAAALYWLDCSLGERKLAYLYAVATAEAFRGRGLCRALMEDTHRYLKQQGYAGAVLVPGSEGLFRMYEGMGYKVCSGIREFECEAGEMPAPMRQLTHDEYASLRRELLPVGGVIQEGENLTYLGAQMQLYSGKDFIAALIVDGKDIHCSELLGNANAAPGIVAALGAEKGKFRTPGNEKPFAMYHPLSFGEAPAYFGLAFD